jgi:hypothetical protein
MGLRDHSMRTPGQLQQNYPRELAFSEAAALAVIDAIEFRLEQTDDQRLIGALTAVREASGWQTRPSPSPKSGATGAAPVSGRGVNHPEFGAYGGGSEAANALAVSAIAAASADGSTLAHRHFWGAEADIARPQSERPKESQGRCRQGHVTLTGGCSWRN